MTGWRGSLTQGSIPNLKGSFGSTLQTNCPRQLLWVSHINNGIKLRDFAFIAERILLVAG
jgi:hypothetical protein